MGDPGKEKNTPGKAGKYLARSAIAVVCLFALIALAIGIYLATPLPAQHVSGLLTSYLHQSCIVGSLQTSGGTLYLRGVRLDNPPGFSKESMAAADSIAIAPQWGDFLLGRQNFRLIALDGIRIALEKNSKGDWNFGPLQRLMASKKPSPAETRIRQFSIKDGAVRVAGQGVQGITLQIFNLATKGSLDSKLELAFEDAAHDHFALKGAGRAGTDPALDLTLTAPAPSLKDLATLLQLKKVDFLEGGKGSLLVHTSLHKKELSATGSFNFSHMRYSVARKSYPLTGSLEFAADYNLQQDSGHLKTCLLRIDDLVRVHAAGTAQDLKRERNFALDLGFSEIDLAALNTLLPAETRKDLVFAGRLGCRTLHLAGNGSKVTGASGTLQLHDGALTRKGRLLVAGLTGDLGFSRAGAAVLAKGRLSLSGAHGKALLEKLDMPFNLSVSRSMKPLSAEVPSLSAQIMGVSCSGRLAFDASKASPITASLKAPGARLAALGPLLKGYDLTVQSGTADVALELSGSSLQQLGATVGVQVADFQGSRGGRPVALKKGGVSARARRGAGHLWLQGEADLRGLAFNGQGGDARFNYRVADHMVYLDGAELSAAGAQLSVAHLSAALPARSSVVTPTGFPLSVDFDGCTVKRREFEVGSLSGQVRGMLHTDPAGRWLDGTAELASGRVSWQGKVVAAPAARVAFSRPGAKAELQGMLLAGALAGSVSGNPFASGTGAVSFDLRLKEAALAEAAQFVPRSSKGFPSDGLVTLRLNGTYSRPAGLSCRFEAKGSRVALAGAGGKSLVSGAAFSLAGGLAGETLSISDAELSPGPGVALKMRGELVHPFSGQRAGNLSFSLPEAEANSIVDPLINLLPRVIQEATIDGRVAAQGKLELRGGGALLEGALAFKGGRFEVTEQKLVVSGINGRLPFSLDLARKTGGIPPSSMPFSRENYPQLLNRLRQGNSGESLTVDKIGFGPMELGVLTMHLTAANGVTEITSLNTSLYEGALLGRGFLTMREGFNYRGDLLLNGLSLKELCSTFPNIKGYISGRVDGVISISGGAKGLAGLTGFTELWAREGSGAKGEKMLVSKEFLQRLAKQKLGGFFFRSDRSYDQAEIEALMEEGYLSFETLQIVHTNMFGVRDLNVSIAPTQNRIALDHLLDSVKQAASRGKAATGERAPAAGAQAPAGGDQEAPATQEFKWGE